MPKGPVGGMSVEIRREESGIASSRAAREPLDVAVAADARISSRLAHPGRTVAGPDRRSDIQGLRALAALMVLFFHVGGWLGHGFVGVDVFFVISGYVISMVYFDRFVDKPTLTTAFAFLRRRLLRLMPAVLTAVVATFLAADLILPPTENKLIALQAGLAALFNYSNFFFVKSGTNYWLDTLVRNPFLHTWSLGVEWQFYLVFPAAMLVYGLACRGTGGRLAFVLAAVLLVAGAASLVAFADPSGDPRWAFFAPWPRCWQFLLGISALLVARRLASHGPAKARDTALARLLALACLAGLLALAALPPAAMATATAAVVASFGTAALLMLAPAPASAAGRLLGSRVAQTLGEASYSIYLAHWPVAVFGRLLLGDGAVADVTIAVIALAGGLALSKTIEFRFMNSPYSGRALAACLAVMVAGYAGYTQRGRVTLLPGYAGSVVAGRIDGFHNYWWSEVPRLGAMFWHTAQFDADGLSRHYVDDLHMNEAVAHVGASGRVIVGIGNSFIQSSGVLLRTYARERDADLLLYDISDCEEANAARCTTAFARAAASIERRKDRIDVIFIAFRNLESEPLIARNAGALIARFERPGVRVVVQGPSPYFNGYDPHSCMRLVRPCPATMTLESRESDFAGRAARLARMFPPHGPLSIWSPYTAFCGDTGALCRVRDGGVSLFMDNDHFSNAGQKFLYPVFLDHMARTGG